MATTVQQAYDMAIMLMNEQNDETGATNSSELDTSEWDAGSYTVRCYAYDGTNIDSIVTTSVVAVSAT